MKSSLKRRERPAGAMLLVVCGLWLSLSGGCSGACQDGSVEGPDLQTVSADMTVPVVESGAPEAGRRVFYLPEGFHKKTASVVRLPDNWNRSKRHPIFVELPGNGGYRDRLGDECTGRPEDCCLGYGLTVGKDWIWVCLPFLNERGDDIALTWWGDAPAYRPEATLAMWQRVLFEICDRFQGDVDRVVLAGFSRGAIACNVLGLHDEATAKLWSAFLPCSHYDGVRQWPFANSDPAAAAERFRRLGQRSQLIMGEGRQTEETRRFLEAAYPDRLGTLTTMSTGFRNHSDRWVLRPCEARERAREWLRRQQR